MRPASIVLLLIAASAGCQPLPEDARETYAPGRPSDVAAGVLPGGTRPLQDYRPPLVMPWRDFPAGGMPLTEPPEVMHIWFFPVVSRDGFSYREGFWCHRVTRTFTWGIVHALVSGSVPLLPEAEGSDDALAPASWGLPGQGEPQAGFLDSLADLGHEAVASVPVPLLPAASAPGGPPATPAAGAAPAGRTTGR